MMALVAKPPQATLRLLIPCELERVRPLAQAVRDFLANQPNVGEEEIISCELALVEACNNAVLYVTEKGKPQPVEVEVVCTESQFQICVDDHTAGFELPETAMLPPETSEYGRGLFLMRSTMDSVHYFTGETRNRLVMTRLRLAS